MYQSLPLKDLIDGKKILYIRVYYGNADFTPAPYRIHLRRITYLHSETASLTIKKNTLYLVPLLAQAFPETRSYTRHRTHVTYDPQMLSLTDHHYQKELLKDFVNPNLQALENTPGKLVLSNKMSVPKGSEWSGMIGCVAFNALESGTTTIEIACEL